MSGKALKADGITVKYGKRVVLDSFTHEFEAGKIHCILGPNGCGKTTLVKALIERYASEGQISYVPQDVFGNVALTTYDTVALGRYDKRRFFTGLTAEDKVLVDKAVVDMELTGLEDRIFDTLSGGEKQRCMTARALAQDTEWTILDEPSSNLDIRHTQITMKKLAELRDKEQKSFIVVLHDVNTAARFADRFVLMKDGKLVAVKERLDTETLSNVFDSSFEMINSREGVPFFCPL
ncbi:iron complex transport system ATP-binding protein [Ruminococcaceae bacterium KH2T8]|nr:iron complex transport system ATP-binding protein [Ruminococcaceae bacterium KH2T8]